MVRGGGGTVLLFGRQSGRLVEQKGVKFEAFSTQRYACEMLGGRGKGGRGHMKH